MAGINTSKSSNPGNKAQGLPPITLLIHDKLIPLLECDEAWEELQASAGVDYSREKRFEIAQELARLQHWKRIAALSPTHQDVIRTLEYISRSEPGEAFKSYENCDANTKAYIEGAARLWGGWLGPQEPITDAQILLGATWALQDETIFPKSKGGRPRVSYRQWLAEYCLQLWQDSGNDPKVYIWGDKQAPLITFTSIIFRWLDKNTSPKPSTILELLQGKVKPL
jgi:hypothetical protein